MKTLLIVVLLISVNSYASDPRNIRSDIREEIGQRQDIEIEVFNYNKGEYDYLSIDSDEIENGSSEVKVFDYNDGEYKYLEIELD